MSGIDAIVVQRVTRLFGATPALRGVSARFERGELVFLEGPNGAGKSTLLAVIGTVLRPTAGSVRYEPLGDDPVLAREHIGWVAHDSHCYRELSGRQNIELAARMRGVDPGDAWKEACKRVGAEAFGDRSFGTLSRGQRQRIALGRALVHSPSLLLLDEPFSGLDPSSAERLEQILVDERDRGSIVVVVNHAPGLAARLGARTVRIENGRIAARSAA
ncbi:MAG: ABC transporter ATP-binding protein [Myxococcales bacterium]|nr:ABC transporter ATP-binding protein [Myxococcales bacterium]MCB9582023.1 ABC transporter ATP-binding protein [Polyangiaceae bacterium]